jgi:RNA polymerase sigma factor (sigma-70 family)
MPPSPSTTSLSLLDQVRNGDSAGWKRFAEIYGPVIFRKCCRAGFLSADAEDLTQQVFLKLFRALPGFRREPPHYLFRKWLATVIRTVCAEWCRRPRSTLPAVGGDDFQQSLQNLVDLLSEQSALSIQDNDMQYAVRQVLESVQQSSPEKHWLAFWKTAIDGRDATDVATELEMSPENVRKIKSRYLKRLREELSELLEDDGCENTSPIVNRPPRAEESSA